MWIGRTQTHLPTLRKDGLGRRETGWGKGVRREREGIGWGGGEASMQAEHLPSAPAGEVIGGAAMVLVVVVVLLLLTEAES